MTTRQHPKIAPHPETRLDPRGLIREAYRMEGLGLPQCRSIFLDWALGRTSPEGSHAALEKLVSHYAGQAPDHPMTRVLQDGLSQPARIGRRGGRAARVTGHRSDG